MRNLIAIILLLITCIASSQPGKHSVLDFKYGYIDTFTVNETKFKIRMMDSTSNQLALEKLEANWILVDSFNSYITYYTNDFDINNDGFNDIGLYNKKIWFAFLYNPTNNLFVSSGYYSEFEFDRNKYGHDSIVHMKLIDTALNIYFDFQPNEKNQWESGLFQVKDYKRTDLGYISTVSRRRNSKKIIGVSAIKRNREAIDLIVLEGIDEIKLKNKERFDYATYWKQNWRKFLPN